MAVASDGYSLRFSLQPFEEPSTRAGRRFARTAEKAEFVGVARVDRRRDPDRRDARGARMLCKVEEVSFLSGPGRGVILIELSSAEDRVLGFIASTGDRDLMTVRPAAARSRPSAPRSPTSQAAAARAASYPARPVHAGGLGAAGGADAAREAQAASLTPGSQKLQAQSNGDDSGFDRPMCLVSSP